MKSNTVALVHEILCVIKMVYFLYFVLLYLTRLSELFKF